jgi:hypothetical protein
MLEAQTVNSSTVRVSHNRHVRRLAGTWQLGCACFLVLLLLPVASATADGSVDALRNAVRNNDSTLFKSLTSNLTAPPQVSGHVQTIRIKVEKAKKPTYLVSLAQLLAAGQVHAGDVVRLHYGSAHSVTAVYMGEGSFPKPIDATTRSFFVYRHHGQLTYNTLPPRITRDLALHYFGNEGKAPTAIDALLDHYQWQADQDFDQIQWLVGRKNDRGSLLLRGGYTTVKALTEGDFEVYRQGSGGFVDAALAAMQKMENNEEHYYGSEVPGNEVPPMSDPHKTNCFLFAIDVLLDAFRKVGDAEAVKELNDLRQIVETDPRTPGVALRLASFLRNRNDPAKQWHAVFWCPDVRRNPYTLTNKEGTPIWENADYWRKVRDTHAYALKIHKADDEPIRVPIDGYLIDYHPVTSDFQSGQALPDPTKQLTDAIASLPNARFAYGIALGGTHSFLLRKGAVCECHWLGIGAGVPGTISPVFEFDEPFVGWGYDQPQDPQNPKQPEPWFNGLILIPPDPSYDLKTVLADDPQRTMQADPSLSQ